MKNSRPFFKKKRDLLNDFIPFSKFVVIDENKQNLGILEKEVALKLAKEKQLDIICVVTNTKTPICKIVNYDNYRFQRQKSIKKQRQNKSETEEKEIRFSASIDVNDLKIKAMRCQKFLEKRKKVKVTMRLRGREKYIPKYGIDKINSFIEMIKDVAIITKPPKLQNNAYNMLLECAKNKSTKIKIKNEKQNENP